MESLSKPTDSVALFLCLSCGRPFGPFWMDHGVKKPNFVWHDPRKCGVYPQTIRIA